MIMEELPLALNEFNEDRFANLEPMPWLAALVCASAFDISGSRRLWSDKQSPHLSGLR